MLLLSTLFSPTTESNCESAMCALIRTLGIKVSPKTIKQKIQEHPNTPSLLTISDLLNEWKVKNVSIRASEEQIHELPMPFIAQVRQNSQNDFIVIRENNGKSLIASDTIHKKWHKVSFHEFIDKWTGVVMLVEPSDDAGEPDYKKNSLNTRLGIIAPLFAISAVIGLWFLSGLFNFLNHGIGALTPTIFFSLKLFGCYITGLLLWYEIDQSNAILKKVCHTSRKVNCHAVLQSDLARPFGLMSWGEIGFFYFSGGFITLLQGNYNPQVLTALSWLNILTLPYIFFSIYYQWAVIKQWCLLCLITQAILLMEFITIITGRMYGLVSFSNIVDLSLIQFILLFALPFTAWLLVKPALSQAKKYKKASTELIKLKSNKEIFESLLLRQKAITADTSGLGITLGNPNGNTKIVKVCNPYCGPCARAHSVIEDLLAQNTDLQVQIIFSVTNSEDDFRSHPVKHFLAIDSRKDSILTQKALNDWYHMPIKEYTAFAKKYFMSEELQVQGDKLNAMNDWCQKMSISFTPTFFINNHQLPESFHIEDIKYLLPDFENIYNPITR